MPYTLLHICQRSAWNTAQAVDIYRAGSLDIEGFIHCSVPDQIADTANLHFAGQTDLVLLLIDPDKLTAPIKYEDAGNGQFFPHLYGPLNVDAVIEVRDFSTTSTGLFEKPADLTNESWRNLRIGDRVRIVRLPSDSLNPELHFDEETRAVFLQLIAANAILTIRDLDEFGHPWTCSFNFDPDGTVNDGDGIGHSLALNDDSWEFVTPLP